MSFPSSPPGVRCATATTSQLHPASHPHPHPETDTDTDTDTNTYALLLPTHTFFSPEPLAHLRSFYASFGPLVVWAPIKAMGRVIVVWDNVEDGKVARKVAGRWEIESKGLEEGTHVEERDGEGQGGEDGANGDKVEKMTSLVVRLLPLPPTSQADLAKFRTTTPAALSTTTAPAPVYNPSSYLVPPGITKNFLISPPGSPPEGWEPITFEDAPNKDTLALDLMKALEGLAVDGKKRRVSGGKVKKGGRKRRKREEGEGNQGDNGEDGARREMVGGAEDRKEDNHRNDKNKVINDDDRNINDDDDKDLNHDDDESEYDDEEEEEEAKVILKTESGTIFQVLGPPSIDHDHEHEHDDQHRQEPDRDHDDDDANPQDSGTDGPIPSSSPSRPRSYSASRPPPSITTVGDYTTSFDNDDDNEYYHEGSGRNDERWPDEDLVREYITTASGERYSHYHGHNRTQTRMPPPSCCDVGIPSQDAIIGAGTKSQGGPEATFTSTSATLPTREREAGEVQGEASAIAAAIASRISASGNQTPSRQVVHEHELEHQDDLPQDAGWRTPGLGERTWNGSSSGSGLRLGSGYSSPSGSGLAGHPRMVPVPTKRPPIPDAET